MKNFAKTAVHSLIKQWGTSAMRQRVWDKEFAAGDWDYLGQPETDLVYRFIAKYARGGSILDLGCGTADIGMNLPVDSYCRYTGVDVSAVALQDVRQKSDAIAERKQRNEFVVSDVERFTPTVDYDAILLIEVLYYFPAGRIVGMLKKLANHLTDEGVIVVQLYDSEKHAAIIDLIESDFDVVEKLQPEDGELVLIAFR